MPYMMYSRGNMFYKFTGIEITNVYSYIAQWDYIFLLEALHRATINLPLHYATLTTCITGTSLHQTQPING